MKKSIRIISAIVLLILVFCISGCGKEESDQVSETKTHASLSDFIGKWKGTGNELSEDNLTLQMNGGLPRTFTRVK